MPEPTSRLQRWILESQQALLNRKPIATAHPALAGRQVEQDLKSFSLGNRCGH